MLGDGTCQPACLTEACDNDRGDCELLCSSGCFFSMANNGVCDDPCYTEVCQWDGTDCDCSPGCTSELLMNEACDYQCNTAECGWDGMRCGCAAGCSFEDLGQCKPQCLVADCNFDAMPSFPACLDTQMRRASKAYYLVLLIFGYSSHELFSFEEQCEKSKACSVDDPVVKASVGCLFDECRGEDCSYLYWDCDSVSNCNGAFQRYYGDEFFCAECVAPLKNSFGKCGEECAQGLTNHPYDSSQCILEADDTTEDNPFKVFVSANYTESDADGSKARPFSHISHALRRATKHYSMVVLMDAEHELVVDVPSALLADFHFPPEITPLDTQWVVWILPYGCLLASTCERAKLIRTRPDTTLLVPGYQNYDSIFCISHSHHSGEFRISHIDFIDASSMTQSSALIDVQYGSLLLRNVSFIDVMHSWQIIKLNFNNTVLLENVNFENVHCSDGCIIQDNNLCDSTPLSTLVYRNGRVSITALDFSEAEFFASLWFMLNVTIESVTFVGSEGSLFESAFFDIQNCCVFLLKYCEFVNNAMGARHAVRVLPDSWTLLQPFTAGYINVTNIVIEHVRFDNNSYTTGSGLYFSFPKVIQRVVVENCTFENENTKSSLLKAGSPLPVSQEQIRGPSYYVAPFQRVDLPPAFFHLIYVRIIHCFIGANPSFIIANLTHINISKVQVIPPLALSNCVQLIWVNASHEVGLNEIFLNSTDCEGQQSVLRLTRVTGNTVLTNIAFVGARANALLIAEQVSSLHMSESIVSNCSNELAFGGIQILGNASSAVLENIILENNSAGSGGAVFISMALQVSFLNCTFRNNSATAGGAVHLSPRGQAGTRIRIVNCVFLRNSASLVGGAINVQFTSPSSTLSLYVHTSIFIENKANKCAGISIAAGIEVKEGSAIENSEFLRHFSVREGVLSLHYFFGSLKILSSVFEHNEGLEESVILVGHESLRALSDVSLILNMVKIENNSGVSIIHALDSDQGIRLHLESVKFLNNSGISIHATNVRVIATAITFQNNFGVTGPTLTLTDSTQCNFTDSVFSWNTAALSAGAILNTDSSVFSCELCQFIENKAGENGGAIATTKKAKLLLNATVFLKNRASKSGSALYFLISNEDNFIQNCTFQQNSAGGSGVLYLFYSGLSIDKCIISANTAQDSPGIFLSLSSLWVSKTLFSLQSGAFGWFLHISSLSLCTIHSSLFRDSKGSRMGALYLEEGSVIATDTQFQDLSARFASVAYVFSRASLTMVNCSIEGQVNKDMGIATVIQTQALIIGCRFLNYSGSAIWGQNAILNITRSEFESDSHVDGKGSLGIGVYCDQCSSTTIETCSFTDLKGQLGSGVSLNSRGDEPGSHEITHCTFLNLAAQQGAAVKADNVHLAVKENQFLRNHALETNGGAIVLSCVASNCVYTIQKNLFLGNTAILNGGALSWTGTEPRLIENAFNNNSALYGNDYSSFVTHIATTNTTTLPPTPSGQVVPYHIVIILRDHYNQTVATENNSQAVLVPVNSQETRVSGVTEVIAVNGTFRLDSFVVEAKPGYSTKIQVRLLDLNSDVIFDVPMRNCVVGESFENNKCVLCEAGKYSFDPSQACQDCFSQAICEGNFTVIMNPGYWRADYLQTTVFQCPNQDACIGQTLTGKCADGYEGNKCQACSKNYFRVSKVFCNPCPSKAVSFTKMLFIFIAISIFAIFIVVTSINSALKEKATTSVYLKILMNYLQLVMLMGAFNLSWPSYVKTFLEIQDSAGGFSEHLASAQCLHDEYSETREFYAKTVVMAVLPVAVTAVSSAVWLTIGVLSRNYGKLHRELVGSAVALFFMLLPSVMRAMFAVFNCEEIRTEEYWITGLKLRCWAGEHSKYVFGVALPCVIIWGVGVPAIILGQLIVKRKELSQTDFKMRYGFLYNGYQPTRFYWEFVVIYRKFVIISLSVFLSRVAVIRQALLAFLTLLISQYLHTECQPYTTAALNTAEHRSLLVSTVTLFAGLYYLGGTMNEALNLLVFVCVIGINVYFLQFWLRQSARAWLMYIGKRMKCLKRFCGESKVVGETNDLTQVKARNLPNFIRSLYFQKLQAKCQEVYYS